MRTHPINRVMSYLAPSLVTTSLFVSTTALAMPLQSTLSTTARSEKETVISAKTTTGDLKKSPVLARNTTPKPIPATPTATVQKNEDKKAVSRCWKRLMNMVREVSHAHRSSK